MDADKFEVDRIVNMRSGRKTRHGQLHHKFLVHWKGFKEPSWVDEADRRALSVIIWKLPEWTIVSSASEFAADLTVNKA